MFFICRPLPRSSPRSRNGATDVADPLGTETQPLNEPSLPVDKKTELKKELGLLEGCAIILGIIIGSGININ